jgi:oligopeptide/dipeptide ABC transporter ATP-binding protein
MATLLEIKNLSVSFDTDEGKLTAVDDVSLHINTGEALGIVGESGCGKSVTAMSILRLLPSPPGKIESGQIFFEGQDLLSLPIKQLQKIRGRSIGMIFQEPMTALSPLHRVGKQLVETLRLNQSADNRDAREISEQWLHKVGIPDPMERMYAYPFQLSGGMRQRVMIAMALMPHPKLIIADEPTTALDVTIQAQIFDLMNKMIDSDMSLILITHDMGVIWEMCDRVIVMYASKIVEEGLVKEVFDNPLHPYTQALLKSMPSLAIAGERLSTIEGQVPSPLNFPRGCHFHDRCPFAMDRCSKDRPELLNITPEHLAACFLNESSEAPVL